MLILTADRVEYCTVIREDQGMQIELPGLAYRGRLFVKGESYDKTQGKQAIARVRQVLDEHGNHLVTIVQTAKEYTLWYLDSRVRVVKEAFERLQSEPQVEVDPQGRTIHRYRGANYTVNETATANPASESSLQYRGKTYQKNASQAEQNSKKPVRRFRGVAY